MFLVWLARRLYCRLILRRAIKLGLRIGKEFRISGRPNFGGEPYLISIGDHVTISFNVSFINHDGATWVFRDRPEFKGLQRFGRIDIGDNVFVGANTTLLPGITIGSNVVVGAGSVVTKDLPGNAVYAGVPARFVCTLDEYVRRSSARCTYYPPEIARSAPRLRSALMEQLPFRPAEASNAMHTSTMASAPASAIPSRPPIHDSVDGYSVRSTHPEGVRS